MAPCSWSYFGDPRSVAHESHVVHGLRRHRGRTIVEDFDLETGAPALDAVRAARGRRPQQPQPRVLPRAACTSSPRRTAATSIRATGAAGCATGVHGAVGRGRHVGADAHRPARPRLRARLHVSEPGRRRRPALPVHARAVLDAVLHVDRPTGGTGPRRARSWPRPSSSAPGRRRDPSRPAVREVLGRARRLDPGDALRRSPGRRSRAALYFARFEGGRFLAADGSVPARSRTCRCVLRPRPRRSVLGRARPGLADGRRAGPDRRCRWSSTRRSTARATRSATRRWDGQHWRTNAVADAGRTLFSYHNSGITFDHADPSPGRHQPDGRRAERDRGP